MMKEILIEQFTTCYDENGWFVALKTALEGVTAEQAAWKPDGVDNSIWENVNHIIFWNERWLQRYRGELNKPEDVENKGTFKSDDKDWDETVAKLYRVMDEWRDKLNAIDDDKLKLASERRIPGTLVHAARSAEHPQCISHRADRFA